MLDIAVASARAARAAYISETVMDQDRNHDETNRPSEKWWHVSASVGTTSGLLTGWLTLRLWTEQVRLARALLPRHAIAQHFLEMSVKRRVVPALPDIAENHPGVVASLCIHLN